MGSPARLITAEELFSYPDPDRYELVRGVPRVCEPPGGVHGRLATKVAAWLDAHVTRLGLGTVLVEAGYVLGRGPDTVRGPDVSFLSAARLSPARIPERRRRGGAWIRARSGGAVRVSLSLKEARITR